MHDAPLVVKAKRNNTTDIIKDFLFTINNKNKKLCAVDTQLIMTAIDYTRHYHKGQTRHSGEPYFYHLIEVAKITSDYLFDTESIVAALLHDIVEDTDSSLEQIEFIFGKRVARIVDAVSKITADHQLSQQEVFNKLTNFSDIEKTVITIKVIDRLHNMRTIHHIKSVEKQKRIANETLHFYISLAKSVNLPGMARELNIIARKVLNQ